jgi:hypothetical protein
MTRGATPGAEAKAKAKALSTVTAADLHALADRLMVWGNIATTRSRTPCGPTELRRDLRRAERVIRTLLADAPAGATFTIRDDGDAP